MTSFMRPRFAIWWVLALTWALFATNASAQTPSDEERSLAKEKFARGVEHMRAENYQAAAEQFERAYAIAPYAVILYNLGIAYEKLDRPVDAVRVMKQVIDEPGNLRPERVTRANETVATQSKRIGMLIIEIDRDGADVRIDGDSIGQSPIAVPRALGSGTHFVEVLKKGFAPHRKEVRIGGERTETLEVTLEATELAFAQLWIRTDLPAAEVWLDGARIAQTPLEQSVPVLPGPHAIELRRSGYHTVIKRVEVGPGATAEIKLTPAVDEDAVNKEGGTLTLASTALENLVLTIDGKRHGVYGGAIALAPGQHEVTVERAGFFPSTLSVHIARGGRLEREVVMDPTPETIADHNADVTLFTALGWTFTATAVLAIGGGIGFTVYNENSAEDEEDAFFPLLEPGQICDPATTPDPSCTDIGTRVDVARENLRSRRPVSYAMFIGGGALLATGITLLVLAPDRDAYAPKTEGLDELALRPIVVPTPEGGFVGLSGRF